MATISFTLPAELASFLNTNVPGFAAASNGGSTLALQVPALPALPSQVVAGLNSAGIQVPADAAAAAPVAAAPAAAAPAAAAPAAPANAGVGLAQFAPAGLAPQGEALENPDLAAANAFVANLPASGAALTAFFEDAAANPAPVNVSEIAAWASAQQQAFVDAFGIA